MHRARATCEYSEWQSIDLDQRELQLDWQSGSLDSTDGFLQLSDGRHLHIQIRDHAQAAHLDRLQITLHDLP